MIDYSGKLHLFAVCVQTLAETRTFLSRLHTDREAAALLQRVDSIIRRINDANRGSGERRATVEDGSE